MQRAARKNYITQKQAFMHQKTGSGHTHFHIPMEILQTRQQYKNQISVYL